MYRTLLGARGAPQHCPIPLVGKNLIVIVLTIYCNSIIYTKYFTFPKLSGESAKVGRISAKLSGESAKVGRISAKLSGESAKVDSKSAKRAKYQPNQKAYLFL
ncbi:hypothetical protein NST77_06025 [Niallia sp. FSL W8-0177]|uniref:hypothetical protein n=1 Tax=Niallia sp. FSL W8-0177 TaxID=2954522 RepID=UPI0030F75F18